MFKPLFLFFLVNVGVSLALVDIHVTYFRAPSTVYATNALDTLTEAYDAFYPHRVLIAEAWVEAYSALHNEVFSVAFGQNQTVVTNATVLINLEVWEFPPGHKSSGVKSGAEPPPPPTDWPTPPSPPTDWPTPPNPPHPPKDLRKVADDTTTDGPTTTTEPPHPPPVHHYLWTISGVPGN